MLAVGLLVGLVGLAGGARAQGCNVVNVETIIPPDNFGHTVYISLISKVGTLETASCQASFPYPASGETDTIQEKCAQLENAVATQCGPQYGTVDDCAATASFQAFDVNFLAELSLGISNDPNVFSQTGNGQAIPDYEGDRIVNSCGGPGFGSKATFGGEASGVNIVEENPTSGIIVELAVFVVDTQNLPPNPPAFDRSFTSVVLATPGDPASTLVAAAASDLQTQVAGDPAVGGLVTVVADGRSIVARTSSRDLGLALVAMTDDTGITSSSIGGSLAGVATLSAPPRPVPALDGYGIALFAGLLMTAAWLGLRRLPA